MEINDLNSPIVHMQVNSDKVLRIQIMSLLRRTGTIVRAWHDARTSSAEDEDDLHDTPHVDNPLLDIMTPAQVSSWYRSQMSVFEPRAAG